LVAISRRLAREVAELRFAPPEVRRRGIDLRLPLLPSVVERVGGLAQLAREHVPRLGDARAVGREFRLTPGEILGGGRRF
jgi:hypothetical protein